jgi:hypothetical protein
LLIGLQISSPFAILVSEFVVKEDAIPLIFFFESGSSRELKYHIGKKQSRSVVSKI